MKTDVECYVCGERVPGRAKFSLARFWAKPADLATKQAVLRITMRDTLPPRNPSAS